MRVDGYMRVRSTVKSLIRRFGYEMVPNFWFKELSLDLSALDFLENIVLDSQQTLDLICVVGCHNGDTIESYMTRFHPKKILGFEPNSKLSDICLERFANRTWITIENLALGDINGKLDFNIYDCDATSSILKATNMSHFNEPLTLEDIIEVPIMRFDDYYRLMQTSKVVDLFHIDTQGADLLVLKGAQRLLMEGKVRFIRVEVEFLEMYEGQHLAWEVIDWVTQQGFIFLGFVENQRKKISGVKTPIWADAIFMFHRIDIN